MQTFQLIQSLVTRSMLVLRCKRHVINMYIAFTLCNNFYMFIVLVAYQLTVNDLEQTGHKTSYDMRQKSRICKREIRLNKGGRYRILGVSCSNHTEHDLDYLRRTC